jgi:hypothetical protein
MNFAFTYTPLLPELAEEPRRKREEFLFREPEPNPRESVLLRPSRLAI